MLKIILLVFYCLLLCHQQIPELQKTHCKNAKCANGFLKFSNMFSSAVEIFNAFQMPVVILSVSSINYNTPFSLLIDRYIGHVQTINNQPPPKYILVVNVKVQNATNNIPLVFSLTLQYLVTQRPTNMEVFSTNLTLENPRADIIPTLTNNRDIKYVMFPIGFSSNTLTNNISVKQTGSTSKTNPSYSISGMTETWIHTDWVQVMFVVLDVNACKGSTVLHDYKVHIGIEQRVVSESRISKNLPYMLGISNFSLTSGSFSYSESDAQVKVGPASKFMYSLIQTNLTCLETNPSVQKTYEGVELAYIPIMLLTGPQAKQLTDLKAFQDTREMAENVKKRKTLDNRKKGNTTTMSVEANSLAQSGVVISQPTVVDKSNKTNAKNTTQLKNNTKNSTQNSTKNSSKNSTTNSTTNSSNSSTNTTTNTSTQSTSTPTPTTSNTTNIPVMSLNPTQDTLIIATPISPNATVNTQQIKVQGPNGTLTMSESAASSNINLPLTVPPIQDIKEVIVNQPERLQTGSVNTWYPGQQEGTVDGDSSSSASNTSNSNAQQGNASSSDNNSNNSNTDTNNNSSNDNSNSSNSNTSNNSNSSNNNSNKTSSQTKTSSDSSQSDDDSYYSNQNHHHRDQNRDDRHHRHHHHHDRAGWAFFIVFCVFLGVILIWVIFECYRDYRNKRNVRRNQPGVPPAPGTENAMAPAVQAQGVIEVVQVERQEVLDLSGERNQPMTDARLRERMANV